MLLLLLPSIRHERRYIGSYIFRQYISIQYNHEQKTVVSNVPSRHIVVDERMLNPSEMTGNVFERKRNLLDRGQSDPILSVSIRQMF
ncbi:hypothetical protein Pcinc_032463 [Petrolisthes cinctipes]|uniref:Uncharacterized protein n=1 Tax=Petrolisthes cinctipes TaxID=88211 RepID=A0AAE1BWM4_PETCI|nr:hypothetical protein Pcinc_035427 [Petrolisthes cinctipes]KAK3861588.1 hypothetical protein Pcinc_032463 [Petrolisthes cinctipes]